MTHSTTLILRQAAPGKHWNTLSITNCRIANNEVKLTPYNINTSTFENRNIMLTPNATRKDESSQKIKDY